MKDLIIPVGTQVVTLKESKLLNESRFQPRGSVAAVKSTPKDSSHSYLVEFGDGSISALKRKEFAIRKQFLNDEAIGPMKEGGLYQFVIYRCVVGSRAFGLDDENSDTDLRGIYLPPAEMHWSIFGIPGQIENDEKQECYWELEKFLVLALKANPNILESLNTPLIEYKSEIAEKLLAIKDIFLSKLIYQTYNGYVMSQFKKLEQDLRSQGKIRWKHAMHLIRLLLQGVDVLEKGKLEIALHEHRDRLMVIKHGGMPWDEVNEWRLRLHKDFEGAFGKTKLPERPDYARANTFLVESRRAMVN